MELGSIVEFIDRQQIMCAVILEVKSSRLRLLTESNREVNLAAGRLLHTDKVRLDLSMGRDKMVDALKGVASKRKELLNQVDIKDLWEVLNSEQVWIDLATMTELCFSGSPCGDHESAVLRAVFDDRLYFKFNLDQFFPNSEEQVARLISQRQEEARRKRIVEAGGDWIVGLMNSTLPPDQINGADAVEFKSILKSYYLFGKESKDQALAKAMINRAKLDTPTELFPLLVKLDVFDENQNIDLLRFDIPTEFSSEIRYRADHLADTYKGFLDDGSRRD
ncbi:MAG: exoribonuclease II, partial [Deltaproteobacteria bacterium]|nr:exoribonuclease II [Deltaproteobacteria bacterium]